MFAYYARNINRPWFPGITYDFNSRCIGRFSLGNWNRPAGLYRYLASGVLIIGTRPFSVGDFVEVDDASGYVFEIGFFNTSLTTRQKKTVFIPNKTILDGNLTNYSKTELIRLDLVYGFSYSDDLLRAKRILEDIVTSIDGIAENPPPQVSVSELGDNSVNFAV